MGLILATVVFVLVLSRLGRIGPFEWAGPTPHGIAGRATPPPPRDPERVLAMRLADGALAPEEYLERLSLLQSR